MSRKLHKKHKYYIKPRQQGATKHILVPAPKSEILLQSTDITNPKTQTRVDNPEDIFNILLRQNFKQLPKSCHAITHSFFVWAAFQFGFTYTRWEISWHCMLKKKEHPFSQKMRIIQLFEGDLNGALKFLMGRRLMYHITHNKVVDADTYGSRLGKTAPEAILNLQGIFDYCRITKQKMGMLFNNADGCYDRIPPSLAEIAL